MDAVTDPVGGEWQGQVRDLFRAHLLDAEGIRTDYRTAPRVVVLERPVEERPQPQSSAEASVNPGSTALPRPSVTRSSVINRSLYWLGGFDRQLASLSMTDGGLRTLTVGAGVLLASTVEGSGFGLALTATGLALWQAISIGLVGFFLLVSLHRLLVATWLTSPSVTSPTYYLRLLPRAILTVAISAALAQPVCLVAFAPAVNSELAKMRAERVVNFAQAESRITSPLAEEISARLAQLQNSLKTGIASVEGEENGRGAGNPGYGAVLQALVANVNNLQSQVDATTAQLNEQRRIDAQSYNTQVAEFTREQNQPGLLDRYHALDLIRAQETNANTLYLLLLVGFILIGALPLIAASFVPGADRGVYMRLLQVTRDFSLAEHELDLLRVSEAGHAAEVIDFQARRIAALHRDIEKSKSLAYRRIVASERESASSGTVIHPASQETGFSE